MARSSLHDALNRIADDGQHVERLPHVGPRLVDPLLGAWLLRRPR